MIRITNVKNNSHARNAGLRTGDLLVSLNDHPVNDFLDYYFYHAEEYLTGEYQRDGQTYRFALEKSYDEDLGLELEDITVKSCSNNCIFCFIKQNPPKMRRQIYFCDEDYRYSFLYGNYITLTELNKTDLNRIRDQRLSPLYISVHATDAAVRKKIFRFRSDDHLMGKIAFLVENRIELHTQVVLVPGLNDGEILEKTIRDLYAFRKMIKTLAIVPVGLTKHRQHLPDIPPVTPEMARDLVRQSRQWTRKYHNNENDAFVYLADEFYLLAGEPFPEGEQYGPYYQIENGVGLCRQLIDSFHHAPLLNLSTSKKIFLVTGKLAEPLLREYVLPYLNDQLQLSAELFAIENRYFGDSVTVSGLLTGQDILAQLPRRGDADCILLPPNCINTDGVFLDDMTPADIQRKTGIPVKIGAYTLEEMVNQFEE